MASRRVRGRLLKLTREYKAQRKIKQKTNHHAGRVWARRHVVGRK